MPCRVVLLAVYAAVLCVLFVAFFCSVVMASALSADLPARASGGEVSIAIAFVTLGKVEVGGELLCPQPFIVDEETEIKAVVCLLKVFGVYNDGLKGCRRIVFLLFAERGNVRDYQSWI